MNFDINWAYFALIVVLSLQSMRIFSHFLDKNSETNEKRMKMDYKLKKARIEETFEGDEDDEGSVEEMIPKKYHFLLDLAEGAGINVEALLKGDKDELAKVVPILQKITSSNKITGGNSNIQEEIIR